MEVKNKNVELDNLEKLTKKYVKDDKHTVLRHALSKTPMTQVLGVLEAENVIEHNFSIENKTLAVTNQKQSGRCWIFAGLNVLREIVAKKLNLDKFELSQNYVAFYDKLEKTNHTLNVCLELVDKPHDDRELMHLLQNGFGGDGGQWDMFANLIKKYGFVPKQVFKETAQSSATANIDALLNSVVRRFASDTHKLHEAGRDEDIAALKESVMNRVYALLCDAFGVPPKKFDFDYVDKNGKYHALRNQTPLKFFEKYVGSEIDNYVSIINSPTKDKPFLKTFTIKHLQNVEEGKRVIHLNLPMERIKELVINTLKNGELVWFGSDVSSYRDREMGTWDDNMFDYETAFGLDIKFEKADMLDFHQSVMNHAMVIVGVNLDNNGVATKWKIENSWGETGEKGFYVMSASWFDRYTYQAVIHKKYLNDAELKAIEQEPILVPPWDPMGTLAD